MDRLERDFYLVAEDMDGNKVIRVDGYCYAADYDEERPYRHVEFCFFFLNPGFTQEQYEKVCDSRKQYIGDYTEEEIIEIMDFFEAKPFPMSQVTQDTPCGWYIDC